MAWVVEYINEAEADLKGLDHSQQLQVLKAIKKVSANPLPNTKGGYGKPLGSRLSSNLVGYLKIKLLKLGIRVVYQLVEEKGTMRIIIISIRDDEKIYRLAQKRIKK
jgi:mRNA interferase RelE/StbE